MNAFVQNASLSSVPVFLFGNFRLEADGTLYRDEEPVHVPPRELAALRLLLERAGRVVTPSEIMQALWGDVHVTPESVLRCMSSLRACLGSDDWIETLYKRGYRIGGTVRRINRSSDPPPARIALMPFNCGPHVAKDLGGAIADESTAQLTRMGSGLEILARDSVFNLAADGLLAHQIGAALGAEFVLTGTILGLPLHYRLRAEMIRVQSGAQIWVEDILVRREQVGSLPEQLVQRIASRFGQSDLQQTLTSMPLASAPPPDESRGLHE